MCQQVVIFAHMSLVYQILTFDTKYFFISQNLFTKDSIYTCVVVVHSCLQLRLIRHEWDTSFFDVGASLKNCSCRLKEQKHAGPSAPERTNYLRVWTKSFPTITFSQQIIGGKLLLGFNWDNHFKLCIKKTTNEKLTEENCA